MGADVHGQRRAGTDRTARQRPCLGGLANLYYWIDRENGIGGFWATQISPFADPASVGGYLDFETAAYATAPEPAAA